MTKRLTVEDFIKRSKELHGDTYNYDQSNYVNNHTKVNIVCNSHGIFSQLPKDHLRGRGCPLCSSVSKSTDEFIKQSMAVHGVRYGYELTKYVNKRTPVTMTCSIHGEFKQLPYVHVRGSGCQACGKVPRIDTLIFIDRCNEVHGGKYIYGLIHYVNMLSKLQIICPTHGLFEQVASDHIRGNGCPGCSMSGFDSSLPGTLYVLCDDERSPSRIKIGISNKLNERITTLRKATPFHIQLLISYDFKNGKQAYETEQMLHKLFSDSNAELSGFDGCSEWFNYSHEILDTLHEVVQTLHTS